MAIDPLQPDRALREGLIEVIGGRKRLSWPAILIPAATQQPRAVGQAGGEGTKTIQHLGLGIGAHQVDLHQRRTKPHHVGMGIDETRNHGRAGGIDQPGVGVGTAHLGLGANCENPAFAVPGHGRGGRIGAIGKRVYARIVQQRCTVRCAGAGRSEKATRCQQAQTNQNTAHDEPRTRNPPTLAKSPARGKPVRRFRVGFARPASRVPLP